MKSQRVFFFFFLRNKTMQHYIIESWLIQPGIQEMLVVKHPLSILQNLRYARHIELDCELLYYLLSLYESNVIL